MKNEKKLLLTTLTMAFSFALLAGGAACNKEEPEPTPSVEYTLTVSPETLTLNLFEESEVEAVAKQDGVVVNGASIVWSSSATNVATVEDGVVESVSCGTTTITATWEGKTATCNVVVADDGTKPTLQVSESEVGLELWATDVAHKLNPKVFYKDAAHDTSSATFTYSIAAGGESVATVNAQGYVTPVSAGTTTLTISATWKGYSGEGMTKEVPITVVNSVETALTAEAEELYVFNGTIGEQSYSNTTTCAGVVTLNGQAVANPELTWYSTNESVATVEEGVVTALAVGETKIYYTYNDGKDEYMSEEVDVKVLPVQISLAKSLGEIALIKDVDAENAAAEVTADWVLAYDGFAEQAATVTKAVTADDKELRVSYDKTNKQLTIYNDKVRGTADAYMQGVLGVQDGGEQTLTIYTQENVVYEAKVTVISREITTAQGLTAFITSYKGDTTALEDESAFSTYGTYTILGADITTNSMAAAKNSRYAGTFDGRGHSITYTGDPFLGSRGAFASVIQKSATIKNTAFIGLNVGDTAAGGLARSLFGVVDNCYISVKLQGVEAQTGGVCWNSVGTIKNTIVNVIESASTSTTKKGTICSKTTGVIDYDTCFSIGVEGKVVYSDATAQDDAKNVAINVAFSADGLKELIGATLPSTYNSYWTLTDTALSFGGTQVLTFTATQS